MFHYLGLLLVASTWLAGLFLLRTGYQANLLTISKHAVTSIKTSLAFGTAMVLVGVTFYWWLSSWLTPHLALPAVFNLLLGLTIACQILIGVFPDTTGWVRQAHRLAAYGMALLFMPLALIITASSRLAAATQIICALLALYMLASFTLIVILRKIHSHYLLFQVLYIVAFELIILASAYLPVKV